MSPSELAFLTELIGKPYRLGAEGPHEFDCYGLARCVLKHCTGSELPEASRVGDYVATIREHGERRNWRPVEEPGAFDLVLMGNVIENRTHLGVWVIPATRGVVLHAHPQMSVCTHDLPSLRGLGFSDFRFYRRR